MRIEVLAGLFVELSLIGIERGLAVNVAEQNVFDGLDVGSFNMERTNFAAALDQRHDGALVKAGLWLGSARAFRSFARWWRLIVLGTPIGFVGFNGLSFATHRTATLCRDRHGSANAVFHEPSGLVGNANRAVQLMG